MSMTADRLLAQYRASGRAFTAGGVRSFVLDAGAPDAEPVVCVHGVPAYAYLYRKVVPALAIRGLRGVAVDLPGLGLAERSGDADYSWSGLSRWLLSAIGASIVFTRWCTTSVGPSGSKSPPPSRVGS
jgi:haloalkane dehalogenase